MKYIVNNCPCFNEGHPNLRQFGECLDLTAEENDCCADIENCLLKRIIGKCKEKYNFCDNCKGDPNIDCIDCTEGGKAIMADEILQMFEIEEVE